MKTSGSSALPRTASIAIELSIKPQTNVARKTRFPGTCRRDIPVRIGRSGDHAHPAEIAPDGVEIT